MRPVAAPNVLRWMDAQAVDELYSTSITQAEILLGIQLLAKGKRRAALTTQAHALFATDFEGRILPFDSEAAAAYAEIRAHRRAQGRPITPQDAQIAAITRVHGGRIATRNVRDFADCGVRVLDPWREADD